MYDLLRALVHLHFDVTIVTATIKTWSQSKYQTPQIQIESDNSPLPSIKMTQHCAEYIKIYQLYKNPNICSENSGASENCTRITLKPKFWNEWMNEKNILGFKLCTEAEKNFSDALENRVFHTHGQ